MTLSGCLTKARVKAEQRKGKQHTLEFICCWRNASKVKQHPLLDYSVIVLYLRLVDIALGRVAADLISTLDCGLRLILWGRALWPMGHPWTSRQIAWTLEPCGPSALQGAKLHNGFAARDLRAEGAEAGQTAADLSKALTAVVDIDWLDYHCVMTFSTSPWESRPTRPNFIQRLCVSFPNRSHLRLINQRECRTLHH